MHIVIKSTSLYDVDLESKLVYGANKNKVTTYSFSFPFHQEVVEVQISSRSAKLVERGVCSMSPAPLSHGSTKRQT